MPRRPNLARWVEETAQMYEIDTNPENFEELIWEYRKLLLQDRETSWARADLAQQAAQTYGKLRRLAEETGDDYGYLKQLSFCAKQYDARTRKLFYQLSFGHFRVVASREDRFALLQKAVDNKWGIDRLRHEISGRYDRYVSVRKVIKNLNSYPLAKFNGMDALTLMNTALGVDIKWDGKRFIEQ